MEEKQLIPQELTSAIAKSSQPNILVNQGDGIQILENHGPMTINASPAELAKLMQQMFNAQPAKSPQTHKVEWASLDREHYCLFVLENEEYNDGVFSISKDRSLQKYTPTEVRNKYRILSLQNIESLKRMPCIFAKRNLFYKNTDEYHPALIGRIKDIIAQGENIKIYFYGFQAFPQQILNQNSKFLHMASASARNELDEEHWSIKPCNLIDTFATLGIDIT